MSTIQKPKYIRKYDYQRYFYRPKEQWFLPTSWIVDTLKDLSKKEYEKVKFASIDTFEEDGEQEESDAFEEYKELKSNVDLDKTDPKVYEGNLIDHQTKQFMIEHYPDCEVYDFDEHNEYKFDTEASMKKTLDLLKTKENIIMFQPTFIYKDKAIARPDGFVKHGNMLTLIETKGTTSVKVVHLVDMTYQAIVVNETLEKLFNKKIDQFLLCIVDYRLGDKNEIGFKFSPYAVLTKSAATSKSKTKDLVKFSNEYIEARANCKDGSEKNILIADLIYNQDSLNDRQKESLEKYSLMNNKENFDSIINELYETPMNLYPTFEPSPKFLCWFKNNDYWINLREYYFYQKKYFMFHYSGFLLGLEAALGLYFDKGDEIMVEEQLRTKKAGANYLELVKKHNFSMGGYNGFAQEQYDILERNAKKVYFDFESLNLATRVIKNTLPFMQTCNQVSVIFDHGDKNLSQSNNVVIDPKEMTLDSYKEIIDAILPSKDLAECEEYIYIVYNKSFECTRLNEMKSLFERAQVPYAKEYGMKVDIINKKIYDLADLFDLRKDCGIAIQKIQGFYSIKKVLPIVNEMCPEIFNQVKCLDYKSLSQVQNGGDAQKESTKRFFNLLTDEEWATTERNLKVYCENDVRAMIAVEYMVGRILKK